MIKIMATAKTNVTWKGNLTFEAEVNGFKFLMDTDESMGGNNRGPRPKPLLLAALSGCSGMDVASILEKMKVPPYQLQIDAEGDNSKNEPYIYENIRLIFNFTGDDLPKDKLIHAVELSVTKYCPVFAMLKKAANIKTFVNLNNEEIWNA